MPTCGYVCPKCEGKGFTDDGEPCDWCTLEVVSKKKNDAISDDEWQRSVHEGDCCSDPDHEKDKQE